MVRGGEVKKQKGVWWIRASLLKLPKQNGKDGSLIEGQATKEWGYLQ